jgi:phage anti-repressor protein
MRNHENETAVTLPLIIQNQDVLVDARLLHQKLKVKSKFADWIKNRINEYGFKVMQDFFQDFRKSTFGRKSLEYHLTLDMAKELAMLERNDIGRDIRRYFIAKEKEVRGVKYPMLPAVSGLFKGLESQKINGRKLYPYREILVRCGYKPNNNGGRAQRYAQHFVKFGRLQFTTEEFALHLYHQKQLYNNRVILRNSQPVLALDFGQTNIFMKGTRHDD